MWYIRSGRVRCQLLPHIHIAPCMVIKMTMTKWNEMYHTKDDALVGMVLVLVVKIILQNT